MRAYLCAFMREPNLGHDTLAGYKMSDGMHSVDQVTRQATPTPANEPINMSRFCDLLQEHAQGSVNCNGADNVMLFGSTGVGKSTMLHLLAGAKFSFEAVELATDESVADEFGTDTELQLITQMKIPGCVIGKRFVFQIGNKADCVREWVNPFIWSKTTHACIAAGNSATSTTMLLNSHHDPSTGLTYIDTPGFNNVSGDDDTTIDAANSAGNTTLLKNSRMLKAFGGWRGRRGNCLCTVRSLGLSSLRHQYTYRLTFLLKSLLKKSINYLTICNIIGC
jgi:hypothetical protein